MTLPGAYTMSSSQFDSNTRSKLLSCKGSVMESAEFSRSWEA